MKIYICPECGQFREASRRKEVICYRCENEVQMQPFKLSMEEYFNMTKEEREEYSKAGCTYMSVCIKRKIKKKIIVFYSQFLYDKQK